MNKNIINETGKRYSRLVVIPLFQLQFQAYQILANRNGEKFAGITP